MLHGRALARQRCLKELGTGNSSKLETAKSIIPSCNHDRVQSHLEALQLVAKARYFFIQPFDFSLSHCCAGFSWWYNTSSKVKVRQQPRHCKFKTNSRARSILGFCSASCLFTSGRLICKCVETSGSTGSAAALSAGALWHIQNLPMSIHLQPTFSTVDQRGEHRRIRRTVGLSGKVVEPAAVIINISLRQGASRTHGWTARLT